MARSVSIQSPVVSRTRVSSKTRPVRYAVVGLGHIAQNAVLPAFSHAKRNSQLTTLVSDDPKKLKQLSKRYHVPHCYSYREYEQCLRAGHIDAVYIALPNSLHCDFTIRAAQAGIHVLCEKPMAMSGKECRRMVQAAKRGSVKLMIAYRLHFEQANMDTVELAKSGKLGKVRFFNSTFTMQVRPGNIRVKAALGGGALYDIGIYCINAARYVFQANPTRVSACSVNGIDRRFRNVDEMTTAWLEFPGNRLATFVCSFGAADTSAYQVVGSKGHVRMEPAYEYEGALRQTMTLNGKSRSQRYESGDQFAPELLHFSDCVLKNHDPEPSGLEGLIDVEIIEALYRSAKLGRPISLELPDKQLWPTKGQVINRSPIRKPILVRVKSPSL